MQGWESVRWLVIGINPDELRSDRRGACQIVADRGPDLLGKQKNTRLANHHAQDVVVLRKLAKSNTESEPFGTFLNHF